MSMVGRTDELTDGRKEGRTDRRTHYYSPLRLTSGDKKTILVRAILQGSQPNVNLYSFLLLENWKTRLFNNIQSP